ncbi:hypothetical protein DL764_003595 [Monosporascus ibericus]|uniref:Uncharacterized protein n=1 Tax=Monosporascus ibericus TaxID=155417 RepID=A0A4Q4TJ90_9PEZI|nr:hypothetical protein DL764_003595 [Monosporascus ibericus]
MRMAAHKAIQAPCSADSESLRIPGHICQFAAVLNHHCGGEENAGGNWEDIHALLDDFDFEYPKYCLFPVLGRNIESVLQSKIDTLDLLFASGTDMSYASVIDNSCDHRFQAVLGPASHETPYLQTIEVGAATAAPSKFAEFADRLTFKKLDLERDPWDEGFELGAYDMVIVGSVLHATPKLATILAHVHIPLRPGGHLADLEITFPDSPWANVGFGSLPSWWLSTEEWRQHGPLVAEQVWQALVCEAGFSGLELCLGNQDTHPALAAQLSGRHEPVQIVAIGRMHECTWAETDVVASLLEVGTPRLAKLSNDDFQVLREFTLKPHEVEIEAKAWPVSFRDVLIALGRLGQQSLVTAFAWSYQVACATTAINPGMTAFHALINVARLQTGEKIAIRSAAGSTGHMAIWIAKHVGATVGFNEKKQLPIHAFEIDADHIFYSRDGSFAQGIKRITNGYRVDGILNSLSSDSLRASWACIAPYGRFVENSKKDIGTNASLPMGQFAFALGYLITSCFVYVKSKVDSSWNLHQQLPRDMDFFILLSSLSGIYGSLVQGNYAVGCTFQDALAQYRIVHGVGKKPVSLDLGWMRDVGIVTEREEYRRDRANVGDINPVESAELIALPDLYCDPILPLPEEGCGRS